MEDLRNNVNLDRHEACGDYSHGYDHHHDHHDHHCCSTDPDLKPVKPCNDGKCCDPLTYDVHDISTFDCIPILADRVFDCTKLESTAMGMQGLTFSVTSVPHEGSYAANEAVCIEKIGLSYDCIGLDDPSLGLTEFINSQYATFNSWKPSCTTTAGSLYTEYHTHLTEEYLCTDHKHKDGAQVRLYSKYPPYAVSNLKIVVSGKIGCKYFKAEYDAERDFGILVNLENDLDLSTQFSGKLCVPSGVKATILKDFDGKLFAPCANATTPVVLYTNTDNSVTPIFKANVEFCLEAIQTVYSMVREKLAVVASDCAPCPPSHVHHCDSHHCK